MYLFNNNHITLIRAKVKFTPTQDHQDEAIIEQKLERPFGNLIEATNFYNSLLNSTKELHQFVPYDSLAPKDECLIFGYGYGAGEIKSPVRDSDELDDQLFIRPWPAAATEDLNKILYHNKWRTFTMTFSYADDFRLYVKYGNSFGSAYIRDLLIDNKPAAIYPDTNADIVEFDGYNAVHLPSDWSKGFLLGPEEALEDGEHIISFDYYVDAPEEYTDPPLEPRHIYKDVTMETFDVSDCEWMEGLYFATKEDADAAYEMGEEAYLRSLPDTNARLTEQVTALEMAIVDIYESMEG